MARSKASSGIRPDIASRGRFDALALDHDESSDEDAAPPPATSTLSPSTPATPSKKSLARQRAKLRKKSSQLGLNDSANATDSDVSLFTPAASALPPVPSLPSKVDVLDRANGLKEQVKEKAEEIREVIVKSSAPVVQAVAPVVQAVQEQLPAQFTTPTIVEPHKAPESVATTDDGESDGAYSDDEDEDDEDEPAAATAPTSPYANSPRPASPQLPLKKEPVQPAAVAGGEEKPAGAYTGADHDPNKKLKAIIQRTVWGVVMACGCIGLVCMGHVYVIALVFVIQAIVFKELTGLFDAGYSGSHAAAAFTDEPKAVRTPEREAKRKERREDRERWSRRMAWYFFAVTNWFLYGESLIYYGKYILTVQASFLPTAYSFAQHHRLVSFGLYVIGFVSFVATLNRNSLRRQFGLFGWIHMSLFLIVVSSHFIVDNILEGMIWFWIPASLVIMNDIAAYVCGMLFGRHQLIKLSPKKTVEGFVGAFFVTIVFAYLWGTLFMRYNYMICPVRDLSTSVFSQVQCEPNSAFVWRDLHLPSSVTALLEPIVRRHITSIPWAPFQLHSVVLATFASLVAPFGGFFASGFKRGFGIKDFGDSIPGHGGMTDRMDCQFLMGLFAYVYYAALIRETHITPQSVLALAVAHLTAEQQVELVRNLGAHLAQRGVSVGKW
ncbi:phosphatidate cytidylyltransferase [Rhodotorula kratochvilovae]